jgi:hypothetical protein
MSADQSFSLRVILNGHECNLTLYWLTVEPAGYLVEAARFTRVLLPSGKTPAEVWLQPGAVVFTHPPSAGHPNRMDIASPTVNLLFRHADRRFPEVERVWREFAWGEREGPEFIVSLSALDCPKELLTPSQQERESAKIHDRGMER